MGVPPSSLKMSTRSRVVKRPFRAGKGRLSLSVRGAFASLTHTSPGRPTCSAAPQRAGQGAGRGPPRTTSLAPCPQGTDSHSDVTSKFACQARTGVH